MLKTQSAHRLAWPGILTLLALSILVIGLIYRTIEPFDPARAICCDHLYYRATAYNLLGMSRPDLDIPPVGSMVRVYRPASATSLHLVGPFAYRVAAPLVARVIGLPLGDNVDIGFHVLAIISLVLAAFFLGLGAWQMTGHMPAGAIATLLFTTNLWLAPFYLFDFERVDPLAFALLSLAVWLLACGRRRAFLTLCMIAPFVREALVVLPACVVIVDALSARLRPSRLLGPILVLVPYLAFRLWLPILNPTQAGWSFTGSFLTVARTWQTFGLLWPLAALDWFSSRSCWPLAPLVAVALGGALFVSNVERSVSYAYPAVILGAVSAMASIPARFRAWTRSHSQ